MRAALNELESSKKSSSRISQDLQKAQETSELLKKQLSELHTMLEKATAQASQSKSEVNKFKEALAASASEKQVLSGKADALANEIVLWKEKMAEEASARGKVEAELEQLKGRTTDLKDEAENRVREVSEMRLRMDEDKMNFDQLCLVASHSFVCR
mmetsp:Transcript_2864/g.6851  ORF Transcript_2864/g.6851 Transcript_2864/m.6851 type:complete len:156 (+) Transcript_2864:784-1251(+)